MTTPVRRTSSTATPSTVNLYCEGCKSQIGIFENEWIRLTSSYARSKDKGTHFGTEVGNRIQVVPAGAAHPSAEGCAMAEVFCRKCSNTVGQYCKSARDADKQSLVDQYFYKLSRTFLKDSKTNQKLDPVFGYGSDLAAAKLHSFKLNTTPRNTLPPHSLWNNTPLRQSSGTPTSVQTTTRTILQEDESQRSSVAPTEEPTNKNDGAVDIETLRQEMELQSAVLETQSARIFNNTKRISEQEDRLQDQDARIIDQDTFVGAQADRIALQDKIIGEQQEKLRIYASQLEGVTAQLKILQQNMNEFKASMGKGTRRSNTQVASSSELKNIMSQFSDMVQSMRGPPSSTDEAENLRQENMVLRERLDTIRSAMGIENSASPSIEPSTSRLPAAQVLGKRKRKNVGVDRASSQVDSGTAVLDNQPASIPTPQLLPGELGAKSTPEAHPSRGGNDEGASRVQNLPLVEADHVDVLTRAPQTVETSIEEFFGDVEMQMNAEGDILEPAGSQIVILESETPLAQAAPKETSATQAQEKRRGARNTSKAAKSRQSLPLKKDKPKTPRASLQAKKQSTPASAPAQNTVVQNKKLSAATTSQGESSASQLPTVQDAGKVLGIDLSALTKLSESLQSPQLLRGISVAANQDVDVLMEANPGHDNTDFSDDVEEINQPAQNLVVPEQDPSATSADAQKQGTNENFVNRNVACFSSIAPEYVLEPSVLDILNGTPTRPVSLDRMRIATPDSYTNDLKMGREPKPIKPTLIHQRERMLNEELIELGLGGWIGKNKKSKEYQDAVAAARAKARIAKRAAFLSSHGLDPSLADSPIVPELEPEPEPEPESSDLPTTQAEPTDGIVHTSGVTDSHIQDLQSHATSALARTEDANNAETEQESATGRRRSARVRKRRSSVVPSSDLAMQESGPSENQRATRKRVSDTTVRSRRKSGNKPTMHTEADDIEVTDGAMKEEAGPVQAEDEMQADHAVPSLSESVIVPEPVVVLEATANLEPEAQTKGKPARRRSKRSDVQPVEVEPQRGDPHTESTAEVIARPSEDVSLVTSEHSAAQLRQEAILARERLAQEAMELDEMFD